MQQKFNHPVYGKNGSYEWPSSFPNALKIIQNAVFYVDLFELLSSEVFCKELNLHSLNSELVKKYDYYNISHSPFFLSKLTKKEYFLTLSIRKWKFHDIIFSAFFYVFKDAYEKQNKDKITEYCLEIMKYLWNSSFTKMCVEFFEITNLVELEQKACVRGFLFFFIDLDLELPRNQVTRHCTKNNLLSLFSILKTDESYALKIIADCQIQDSLEPLITYLWSYFPTSEEE